MFARKSDLYLDVIWSCSAFSFSSAFFCWSSWVSAWDRLSRSSVLMVAAIVLSTMPNSSVSWSKNVWCTSLNWRNDASSMTAFTCFSKSTGRYTTLAGLRLAERAAHPESLRREVVHDELLPVLGALAEQRLAQLVAVGQVARCRRSDVTSFSGSSGLSVSS